MAEKPSKERVVDENDDLVRPKGIPEVPDGQVGTQQLVVRGAVLGLGGGELLGEES